MCAVGCAAAAGGPPLLRATAPPACILTDSTSHTSERRPRGHTPALASRFGRGTTPAAPATTAGADPPRAPAPDPPKRLHPGGRQDSASAADAPWGRRREGMGRSANHRAAARAGATQRPVRVAVKPRPRGAAAVNTPTTGPMPRVRGPPPSGRVLPPPTAASAAKCDVLARGAGLLALARPVHGPVLCHVERRHSPWPGVIGAATWTAHRRLGHAWGPPGHVVVPARGVCRLVATPSAQKGRRIRFSARLAVVCGGHAARWTAADQKNVGGWPTPAGGYILLVLPGHVVEHLPSAPPRPRPGGCEWLGWLERDGRLPRPPPASREGGKNVSRRPAVTGCCGPVDLQGDGADLPSVCRSLCAQSLRERCLWVVWVSVEASLGIQPRAAPVPPVAPPPRGRPLSPCDPVCRPGPWEPSGQREVAAWAHRVARLGRVNGAFIPSV